MRSTFAIVVSMIAASLAGTAAEAQDSYKVEALDEAPPDELAGPIREQLQPKGVRVFGSDGKPFVDLWLRKAIPATSSPGEPANSIICPFLEVGQLVGAMRLAEESGDYKDQPILAGTYTMRYGLQPVNGDHLGVSTYRDYFLLSLPDEDTKVDPVSEEDLEFLSTGVSGTTHPTVFLLLPAPDGVKTPAIVRDEQNNRTGVVVTMPIAVEGQAEATSKATQLIVVGAGPH